MKVLAGIAHMAIIKKIVTKIRFRIQKPHSVGMILDANNNTESALKPML